MDFQVFTLDPFSPVRRAASVLFIPRLKEIQLVLWNEHGPCCLRLITGISWVVDTINHRRVSVYISPPPSPSAAEVFFFFARFLLHPLRLLFLSSPVREANTALPSEQRNTDGSSFTAKEVRIQSRQLFVFITNDKMCFSNRCKWLVRIG